jgi:hypothetical protein
MSEKTARWLTVHAPVALSLLAIMATGGVAYGATQSTSESNKDRIDALEYTITSRFDKQDDRIDRIMEILIYRQNDATSEQEGP